MKIDLRKTCLSLIGIFALSGYANAELITINFTADNIVNTGGLCNNSDCLTGIGWSSLGTVSNLSDWRNSDSITIDLGPGTYYFAWYVDNLGAGSDRNPAGLLAEILWSGGANYSSSGWDVTTNVGDPSSWVSATTYGANGASNIWTSVNGGAVSGISTNAEWLWTSSNFSAEMDQKAVIRTSITIVPEPGTLGLLGLGLLGIGFVRRKAAVRR